VCGICGVQDLGAQAPQSVTGNTTGSPDLHTPPCAQPGGGEAGFLFTAPADGAYTFDTLGSSYDTVLTLLEVGICGVLACDDDGGGGSLSQIAAYLAAGQTVLVIVDGFNGQEGPFTLNIDAAAQGVCPNGALMGMLPLTVTGSTAGAGDDVPGACGGGGGQDIAFTFTAPADGTYSMNTQGSSYDTVLQVRDGGCGGPVLACNDDTPPGTYSALAVPLLAGQTVVIVVEGFAGATGSFVLNVSN
jgi:hypothetical protein